MDRRTGGCFRITMTTFLHAAYADDRLCLWGETAAASAAPLPRPRGRRRKGLRPEPNPFDAGAEALDTATETLGLSAEGDIGLAVLWLPTRAGRPLASSPVIEEPPEALDGIALAPWETAALELAPADAVELLSRCAADHTLAPGLFAAPDLAFWSTALRFAGALVARGSVLPDLVRADGRAFARWRPVFLGRDAQALARLAQA